MLAFTLFWLMAKTTPTAHNVATINAKTITAETTTLLETVRFLI
jgi:hypothetical protein